MFFLRFPRGGSKWVKIKNIEILKGFKVSLVGTLNLCLEMADLMEKVWAQSDHPVVIVKTANFLWFLGFFSARIDTIKLKPFSLNHASRDPSLEYQQGILWSTLKYQYFLLWPPLLGKIILTRNLHFRNYIVIEHQLKLLAKIFSTKRGDDIP